MEPNVPVDSAPVPALIKLPFWETCRRSFLYVMLNLPALFKIAAVWYCLLIFEMFSGYPNICGIDGDACADSWEQHLSSLLLVLSSVSIIVAFSRFVILNEPADKLRFVSLGRREVKYILYMLALIVAVMIPMLMVPLLMSFSPFAYYFLLVFPVVLAIAYARFYLIFPAITVDNNEMTLKKSFELTKGNANKIFWGQALMSVPVFAVLIILSVLYKALGIDNAVLKLVFTALIMTVSFIDAALKASFFAHAYQYFLYFDKKAKR